MSSKTARKLASLSAKLAKIEARQAARKAAAAAGAPYWRDTWATPQRQRCGARRTRDGQPCQAPVEPGKRRCRFHGGRSTGAKTPEGKARALANLRRGRRK